jgi:polygalacturonase
MNTRLFRSSSPALALVALASLAWCAHAATFNVRDYGAVGDGHAIDSPAIQKTIDACVAAGGGTIILPSGTYLSKPLFLRGNHVIFQLDAGAVLQGTTNFDDYKAGSKVVGLLNADRMTDISIIGSGAIDGAGEPWWPAVREAKKNGAPETRRRPKMVNINRCHGVTIRDVTLRNSPSFHLVPVDCDDVLIDHVTINAPGNSPNTDAIDPGSCQNVRIINCTLDVGDDNVAIKAGHPVPGREFCCENIIVSNCTCLHGTVSGLRIKSTRGKGGTVEHVFCSDLTMKNVKRPIDIACYYPRVPQDDPGQPVSSTTPAYHDIRIENLTAESPEGAGLIVGLPESPIRGITLTKVKIKAATGLLVQNAEDVHFNDVKIDAAQGEPVITKNAKVQ